MFREHAEEWYKLHGTGKGTAMPQRWALSARKPASVYDWGNLNAHERLQYLQSCREIVWPDETLCDSKGSYKTIYEVLIL